MRHYINIVENGPQLMFRTVAPDDDWKAWHRERKNTADTTHDHPQVEKLKRILLSYGGWAANIYPDDPDLTRIIERGEIMNGRGSVMMKGKPVNCHANIARLWEDGLVKICTGYAMNNDGFWRQHSWGLGANGKIVETTTKRLAYFGFVLTNEEAKSFAQHN